MNEPSFRIIEHLVQHPIDAKTPYSDNSRIVRVEGFSSILLPGESIARGVFVPPKSPSSPPPSELRDWLASAWMSCSHDQEAARLWRAFNMGLQEGRKNQ